MSSLTTPSSRGPQGTSEKEKVSMNSIKATNPATFLSQLDRNIQATERDIEKMGRFLKGLQLARDSVSGVILTDATQPRSNNGHGSRTEALKQILASTPEPIGVDTLVEKLSANGFPTEKRLVSSTLSYGARKGWAKNPERGKWVGATEIRQAA
jgi:hypothetical protein